MLSPVFAACCYKMMLDLFKGILCDIYVKYYMLSIEDNKQHIFKGLSKHQGAGNLTNKCQFPW